MNRRNFLGGIVGILPAATCYARIWNEIARTEMPASAMLGGITIIWEDANGLETDRSFIPSKHYLMEFKVTLNEQLSYAQILNPFLKFSGLAIESTPTTPKPWKQ